MGLNITLRTDESISLFKKYLLYLINIPDLTRLLVCSGYFQEDLWGYSVLEDDDLLYALKTHPHSGTLEIILVGGKFRKHGDDVWYSSFKKFAKKLNKEGFQTFL